MPFFFGRPKSNNKWCVVTKGDTLQRGYGGNPSMWLRISIVSERGEVSWVGGLCEKRPGFRFTNRQTHWLVSSHFPSGDAPFLFPRPPSLTVPSRWFAIILAWHLTHASDRSLVAVFAKSLLWNCALPRSDELSRRTHAAFKHRGRKIQVPAGLLARGGRQPTRASSFGSESLRPTTNTGR